MQVETQTLIQKEKIKHLYMNAVPGMAVTCVVSSVLAFGFEYSSLKLVWWLVLNGSLLLRVLDYFRWKNNPICDFTDLIRFRLGILTTAVIWPVFCIYFYNPTDVYETSTSMIVVAGMAGGATTVMAGDKFSAFSYVSLLILPFSLRVLFDSSSPYQMIGVLGLAFYLVMWVIGKKTIAYVNESIKLRLENRTLIESMNSEINRQISKNKELLQLDSLTGLLNRSAFIDKCSAEVVNADNYAIFFIDLNNFKPVNDNLGHKVGDKVLTVIADKLKNMMSPSDLICRWGGDEFVILKKCSEPQSIDLSYKISNELAKEFFIEGYRINTGAAIGISLYPLHSKKIDELIAFADMAMYINKNNGSKTGVVFDFSMSEKVSNDFYLSSAVRESISKQQLKTYFQPIVDATTQQVQAVEALVRWEISPNKYIPPDVFIPLAEKNGFIVELGYWVLKDALSQIKSLDKYGQDLHICVNVSLIQLQDKNFVDNVVQIINEIGLNPNRLHIELTESVFSSDSSFIAARVKQLQEFGIKISIDDFGTGYSSLSLIQSLHVNIVKVDKSFVSKIHGSGIDVVKAVLVMSAGFGYDIVAEGVETHEQAEMLTALGVKYLQGYLFSKPVALPDLILFLEMKKLRLS